MSQEEYEVHGADFSEHVRAYREGLRAATAEPPRLDVLQQSWLKLCEHAPADQPRLDDDFFLFYALMAAVDMARPDEAKRVYDLMSPKVRAHIDLIEESNPGNVKMWISVIL